MDTAHLPSVLENRCLVRIWQFCVRRKRHGVAKAGMPATVSGVSFWLEVLRNGCLLNRGGMPTGLRVNKRLMLVAPGVVYDR